MTSIVMVSGGQEPHDATERAGTFRRCRQRRPGRRVWLRPGHDGITRHRRRPEQGPKGTGWFLACCCAAKGSDGGSLRGVAAWREHVRPPPSPEATAGHAALLRMQGRCGVRLAGDHPAPAAPEGFARPPGPRRVWRNSPRPGGAGFLWRTCNPGLRFAGAGLNPSRRFATDGGSSGPRREAANGFQPRAEPETAAEVPRAQAAAKAKPWVPSATPISSPEGAAGGPPPRCGRRHIRPRSGRQDVARWRRPSPGARTSPGFAKDHIPSCPSRPAGPQGLPVRPIA